MRRAGSRAPARLASGCGRRLVGACDGGPGKRLDSLQSVDAQAARQLLLDLAGARAWQHRQAPAQAQAARLGRHTLGAGHRPHVTRRYAPLRSFDSYRCSLDERMVLLDP